MQLVPWSRAPMSGPKSLGIPGGDKSNILKLDFQTQTNFKQTARTDRYSKVTQTQSFSLFLCLREVFTGSQDLGHVTCYSLLTSVGSGFPCYHFQLQSFLKYLIHFI